MAPKKSVKMDLNSFLNDESLGSSWADEDVDLNKISIPIEHVQANTIPLEELAAANRNKYGGSGSGMGGGHGGHSMGGGRGSHLDPALGGGSGGRRDFERTEYPVPDAPPYRAIINNIPWDITPEGVQAWVEDGLQREGAVEEISLPKDMRDPTRLKGLAFVAFKTREDLVKALTFNATKLNERTVYISVAAPRKGFGGSGGFDDFDWGAARGSNFRGEGRDDNGGAELDWGSARGSNFQERRPRREEPNLDWSSARGSGFQERGPRREEPELDWNGARGSNFQDRGSNFQNRPPRREEPNLDWSSARGSNFQERAPRREEANLDWSSARGSSFQERQERKPRTEEPTLDWSGARGSNFQERGSNFQNRKPKRDEPSLDWGAARGSNFQERKPKFEKSAPTKTEETPKIQKSVYDVLSNDDDEDEEETVQQTEKVDEVTQLQKETAKLSVEDDGDDWEVTGKK